jgi:hypothetical protein
MGTAEQTTIMPSLVASVEPSGACTALHLWAMAGAGKTWKRGEGRAETEQRGDLQYNIVPHKYKYQWQELERHGREERGEHKQSKRGFTVYSTS